MVVQELRGQFQLSLLLKTAGISKQIYYYEIKHINDKNKKDKFYEDLILEIFHNNYDKYGIPRITIELNRRLEEMGIARVNHKKVERLMKKLDIKARPKTRGYKSFKGEFGKKCRNQLLDKKINEKTNSVIYSRNFFTDNIFQKIGTDITVFIMPFGKLYLSPIIDFHSREVLAYNLSGNPNYKQIQDMFVDLINKHGDSISGAILQSDMGWQYQMQKYHDKLEELKIIQSMSRKGNCLDNSPTENFFGRMKEEMFYGKEHLYKNISQLREAIIRYIEYYNKERIVVKLGMSPYRYRLSLQNNCNLV